MAAVTSTADNNMEVDSSDSVVSADGTSHLSAMACEETSLSSDTSCTSVEFRWTHNPQSHLQIPHPHLHNPQSQLHNPHLRSADNDSCADPRSRQREKSLYSDSDAVSEGEPDPYLQTSSIQDNNKTSSSTATHLVPDEHKLLSPSLVMSTRLLLSIKGGDDDEDDNDGFFSDDNQFKCNLRQNALRLFKLRDSISRTSSVNSKSSSRSKKCDLSSDEDIFSPRREMLSASSDNTLDRTASKVKQRTVRYWKRKSKFIPEVEPTDFDSGVNVMEESESSAKESWQESDLYQKPDIINIEQVYNQYFDELIAECGANKPLKSTVPDQRSVPSSDQRSIPSSVQSVAILCDKICVASCEQVVQMGSSYSVPLHQNQNQTNQNQKAAPITSPPKRLSVTNTFHISPNNDSGVSSTSPIATSPVSFHQQLNDLKLIPFEEILPKPDRKFVTTCNLNVNSNRDEQLIAPVPKKSDLDAVKHNQLDAVVAKHVSSPSVSRHFAPISEYPMSSVYPVSSASHYPVRGVSHSRSSYNLSNSQNNVNKKSNRLRVMDIVRNIESKDFNKSSPSLNSSHSQETLLNASFDSQSGGGGGERGGGERGSVNCDTWPYKEQQRQIFDMQSKPQLIISPQRSQSSRSVNDVSKYDSPEPLSFKRSDFAFSPMRVAKDKYDDAIDDAINELEQLYLTFEPHMSRTFPTKQMFTTASDTGIKGKGNISQSNFSICQLPRSKSPTNEVISKNIQSAASAERMWPLKGLMSTEKNNEPKHWNHMHNKPAVTISSSSTSSSAPNGYTCRVGDNFVRAASGKCGPGDNIESKRTNISDCVHIHNDIDFKKPEGIRLVRDDMVRNDMDRNAMDKNEMVMDDMVRNDMAFRKMACKADHIRRKNGRSASQPPDNHGNSHRLTNQFRARRAMSVSISQIVGSDDNDSDSMPTLSKAKSLTNIVNKFMLTAQPVQPIEATKPIHQTQPIHTTKPIQTTWPIQPVAHSEHDRVLMNSHKVVNGRVVCDKNESRNSEKHKNNVFHNNNVYHNNRASNVFAKLNHVQETHLRKPIIHNAFAMATSNAGSAQPQPQRHSSALPPIPVRTSSVNTNTDVEQSNVEHSHSSGNHNTKPPRTQPTNAHQLNTHQLNEEQFDAMLTSLIDETRNQRAANTCTHPLQQQSTIHLHQLSNHSPKPRLPTHQYRSSHHPNILPMMGDGLRKKGPNCNRECSLSQPLTSQHEPASNNPPSSPAAEYTISVNSSVNTNPHDPHGNKSIDDYVQNHVTALPPTPPLSRKHTSTTTTKSTTTSKSTTTTSKSTSTFTSTSTSDAHILEESKPSVLKRKSIDEGIPEQKAQPISILKKRDSLDYATGEKLIHPILKRHSLGGDNDSRMSPMEVSKRSTGRSVPNEVHIANDVHPILKHCSFDASVNVLPMVPKPILKKKSSLEEEMARLSVDPKPILKKNKSHEELGNDPMRPPILRSLSEK